MKDRIKNFIYGHYVTRILFWVLVDTAAGLLQTLGRFRSDSGSTHDALSVESSLAYINRIYVDYLRLNGNRKLSGHVVELGPGDNAGLALLLRRDGAAQVDLVDRFYSLRDVDRQVRIYSALNRAEQGELQRFRLQDDWDEQQFDGIHWVFGKTAESFCRELVETDRSIDHVISRAVLEHVSDPLQILDSSLQALHRNGSMLHIVDLRDHALFSTHHPELTFLSVPDWLYTLMVRHKAGPNRVLLHRYRVWLDEMAQRGQIQYRLEVTDLVQVGTLDNWQPYQEIDAELRETAEAAVVSQRRRFQRQFRDAPLADLAVSGFALWVRKN